MQHMSADVKSSSSVVSGLNGPVASPRSSSCLVQKLAQSSDDPPAYESEQIVYPCSVQHESEYQLMVMPAVT